MGEKVRSNQFPFESRHYNELGQLFGPEFSWKVAVMAANYRTHGGCNPTAVDLVFPNGKEGSVDEAALHDVLINFEAWHELD
jgi:hypothetical protein